MSTSSSETPASSTPVHAAVARVTERIRERSQASRAAYLAKIRHAATKKPHRLTLGCSNFAHGFAGCTVPGDKAAIQEGAVPNVAIVTAYNDMLVGPPALRRLPGDPQGSGAAGRRRGPGGRRGAGDVRWRDPGRARHGAFALLARHHRPQHGDRPLARHVRRRALPRHLRQDRARAADRSLGLRPPALHLRARRTDAVGPLELREGQGAPALRRRQGRPGRAAGLGGGVLPLAGYLHVLRHRQLQPDVHGDPRHPSAGQLLRQSRNPAARSIQPGRRPADHRDHVASAANPNRWAR